MSAGKKKVLVSIGILAAGAIGYGLYLFYQPHRNIQKTKSDFSFQTADIVNEYLANTDSANAKYLDEQGESKVIEVTGAISEISSNFNGNLVILLGDINAPSGISCTFIEKGDEKTINHAIGDTVIIKGMITAGASYDKDLDMYENVILEDCAFIK